MTTEPVYIIAGTRTAIGDFGGALKDFAPAQLGSLVIAEAIRRAGIAPADVQNVVLGQAIQSEPKDAYIARVAAVNAGVPVEAPALTLNRLCGSGIEAIITATKGIALGEASIAVAGGAESMSRAPYVLTSGRWGQKMGNTVMLDALLEVLSDPFGGGHMGITAENIAKRYEISRETQDALAVESHRRAGRAIAEGRFKEQILPVEVKTRKGVTLFDTDEHVRADLTRPDVAKLKPAFLKDGTVTAGNASGINDGAAALVLASRAAVENRRLKPMARIVSWGHVGVAPEVIRRTLDGKLKVAPDGTYRSSDRYLLIGRAAAARPDPVQAAWLYAQMVRWGQALMSSDKLAAAVATFRPDLYDEILGAEAPLPASEPIDRVGAFTGPAFDPHYISAHREVWKMRRR